MPHPIDVQVGARVRELRIRAGISQQTLAEALGVSYQQIQKYETGLNRMGASRLVQVSRAVGCSVHALFDGVVSEATTAAALDVEAAKVARDWARIDDAAVRRVMQEVIRSLAAARPDGADAAPARSAAARQAFAPADD
ncbi:MAG: helix-turn-helix transcriptional regulator [Marivibrio sp.]|uniref:helix-turn-helix domain-containing protein n=1 Tax=Marivibrio sp. TaxID=2039719 RepID=UPI0032EC67B4